MPTEPMTADSLLTDASRILEREAKAMRRSHVVKPEGARRPRWAADTGRIQEAHSEMRVVALFLRQLAARFRRETAAGRWRDPFAETFAGRP